jgi:hypothetical protein
MTTNFRTLLDRYFYLFMSLLIPVIVIYGFSHTVDQNLFHASPPRPLLLSFHGAVFSTWLAFLIFQSLLVRTRNVKLHRLTGWFGLALGAAMVVIGISTAIVMSRFDEFTLHEPGVEEFLIVPFYDMLAFGVLLALAIYWRKKPEYHRRLILLATCVLTDAGFGRFPQTFMSFIVFAELGVDSLMLLGVLRDLIVNRRIHKVYLYALPAVFVVQWTTVYVFMHKTPIWMHIAHAILG